MAARVVVVGSLNYDITVWVPRRPTRDETLQGSSVAENAGGKGANQAVAASRLGADVVMIGGVGADARGEYLLSQLQAAGVDARWVLQGPTATGTALITVDPEDVSIIIVPGANADVDAKHVERSAQEISAADVLLLQGEVSAEAARAAALIAAASSTTVVFNPAPYNEVAEHVLPLADVVIVNRNEAEELGAFEPPVLITTLGEKGCEVLASGETIKVEAPSVEVLDPTGAGDAFVGAFAVAFVETGDPVAAATIAVRAGAAAVKVLGAQPSMPSWKDIDHL